MSDFLTLPKLSFCFGFNWLLHEAKRKTCASRFIKKINKVFPLSLYCASWTRFCLLEIFTRLKEGWKVRETLRLHIPSLVIKKAYKNKGKIFSNRQIQRFEACRLRCHQFRRPRESLVSHEISYDTFVKGHLRPRCLLIHPISGVPASCWASSQWSRTASSMPCHGDWTFAPLSAHLSIKWECTASQSRYPFVPSAQLISSSDNNRTATLWADNWCKKEWLVSTTRLRTLIPDIGTHPPGMALLRTAWVRLNRLRTGVGRIRSCLYKWGMSPSTTCACGAEEQTVDHVVLHCPIHQLPQGAHGPMVLDNEAIEWLLNTAPRSSAAQ